MNPAVSMSILLLLSPPGGLRAGEEAVATGMVLVPGGTYVRPLERDGKPREVKAFYLDVTPVTNADFLAFVRRNPKWRRGRVNKIFADERYLSHWKGELELGPKAPPAAPVTNVSWFAARAYLSSKGKRLPTVDEWEYAARASATRPDATDDPAFKKRILEWYSRPTPPVLPRVGDGTANVHGIHDLHGLVWEWTRDFNSALATGESRADGSPDSALFCGGAGLNSNNATEYADYMRFAMRSSVRGSYAMANMGFRGAADAPEGVPSTNTKQKQER